MNYFLIFNDYKNKIQLKEKFESYALAYKTANILIKVLQIDLSSDNCNMINHLDIYSIIEKERLIDIIICNEINEKNFK